jgi:hypothetical protein
MAAAPNVTLPATGTGTATPLIETIDTSGTGAGPQRQVTTISDRAGGTVDSIGGLTETAPASDTASSGLNGRLQRIAQRLSSLIALIPAALSPAGNLLVGSKIANPSSVLTRPANTTAYTAGDLVASNTTAGSIVVPSIAAAGGAAGSGSLLSFRLLTNATTGMGGVAFAIEFWSAAPTFTNGDNGAYAIATGAATWLGSATVANMVQVADGAYGVAVPDTVAAIDFALASGTSIFWTLQVTNSGAFTPTSGQTFTLAAAAQQN